jgi:uncharacterized membrane protein
MVEYLGTLTSREQDLLTSFGANGCVIENSWKAAMKAELEGTTKLTSIDMRFLIANKGKCTKTLTTRTGFNINTNGLYASVYDGTTYVGKTDSTIEIAPGLYLFTVKKAAYSDKEVPIEVTAGQIANALITLDKAPVTPGTVEIPIETTGSAKIEWTGKRKFPSPVKVGADNWFGIEMTNSGTKAWVGYIGVKLTNERGEIWKYEGDETKATAVKAGETKYVWCMTNVPTTIGTGNLSISILKYTIST